MNVTIIGAGNMARGIGTRLLAGGNNITLVGRNPEKAGDLASQLSGTGKNGAAIKTAPYGNAISDDVVVLAVPFPADASIVKEYGDKLRDKILIDICTPFNATYDGLATASDTSAAEETAKAIAPGAKVVKAFTTNFSGTLAVGQVAGQPLDVFIAGDDAQAKDIVAELIRAGGMRPLDVGPLQRARYLEGLHLLNATMQSKMDKPWMNTIKFLS